MAWIIKPLAEPERAERQARVVRAVASVGTAADRGRQSHLRSMRRS
jgi:hypothetical protein